MRWEKVTAAAVCCVAFALGLVALRSEWDVDIFWHIAAGRWILEHRALPSTDIFSFQEPVPEWYTFQWLYEVGCAWLDGLGGLLLVRIAHALVTGAGMAAFSALALKVLGRESGERLTWTWAPTVAALLTALLFALYADRVRARPHVVGLVMWPALIWLLFTGKVGGWRRTGVAAALMFVWSNLHAGESFLFLVAALAIPGGAILGRYLPSPMRARMSSAWTVKQACTTWGALLVACLLAPHWARGVAQAGAMLEGSEALIEEWLPFWHYFAVAAHPVHYLCGVLPLMTILSIPAVLLLRWNARPEVLLFGLALAALPFRSARFVYHDAFVLLLLSPSLLGPLARVGAAAKRVIPSLAGAVALLLLSSAVHFHTYAQFGSLAGFAQSVRAGLDERRFPVELVDSLSALARHSPQRPLKVFCLPNWGGYLLYRLYPAVKVVADGRGNFPKETGDKLLFLYMYRHRPDMAKAVQDIYDSSGADVLVMQRPVFPPGYTPRNWIPVAGSRKGEIWARAPTP